jgi:hypothetical protein
MIAAPPPMGHIPSRVAVNGEILANPQNLLDSIVRQNCSATIWIHPDCRSAGETGEEQAVQVRHDEGVAVHIDPEPCVGIRENDGEASAGERAGQP